MTVGCPMRSARPTTCLRSMTIIWEHGWDSFDDEGASITAIVRLGQDFNNAFWHSGLNLLAFGDAKRYAGALDIVGHELTHGVITHSANLVYRDQPGALNEAFADIFGEMIEALRTRLKASRTGLLVQSLLQSLTHRYAI